MDYRIGVLAKVVLQRREAAVGRALRSLGGEGVKVYGPLHKVHAHMRLHALPLLAGLPGVERVSLALGPATPSHEDLLLASLRGAPWEPILAGWRHICGLPPGGATPRVWVRGKRCDSGLVTVMAGEISRRFTLAARQEEADLTVVLTMAPRGDAAIFGIPVLRRRERRTPLPFWGLHPGVCWAMNSVLQLRPGEVVLDPCAGVAALLLELCRYNPGCQFIGLERCTSTRYRAQENVRLAGDSVGLLHGDAAALPLPDESVDVAISDLPFGHRHGSLEKNQTLYPQLLAEIARVLRPRGRVALLTSTDCSKLLVRGEAARSHPLTLVAQVPLLFGGSQDTRECALVCFNKSSSTASSFNLDHLQHGLTRNDAQLNNLARKWRYAKPLLEPITRWQTKQSGCT